MTEHKKISFELNTKLVENELYIRLTDFEIVMKKILDVEQENEKLIAKLKKVENKINAISQKCYEVEDMESIISDLDSLSMELEE